MDEIKKAFRKKALKEHPDKGGDPDKVSPQQFLEGIAFYCIPLTSSRYSSRISRSLTRFYQIPKSVISMINMEKKDLKEVKVAPTASETSSISSAAA